MPIEWDVVAKVATPLMALVLGVMLNRVLERRPRLITYLGHVSAHRTQQQDGSALDVFTHSIVLKNSGRKAAHNVRISHSVLPSFNVFPSVKYDLEVLQDGVTDIVLPVLIPGEEVTISYLYFPPVTWENVNGPVKSDEGFAKVMRVLPTVQYPRWLNTLAAVLMFVGMVSLIYVVLNLVFL